MAAQKKTPAPIDRPLSKAYLREFAGWSTAYPPGISEPNSLRVMNNVMITRDGAARVRPGLRSYLDTKMALPIVGSHEVFYLDDGSKAYLIAVRETVTVDEDGVSVDKDIIGFRVIAPDPETGVLAVTTLEGAGFVLESDAAQLSLDPSATYVRYLQIDNKILALSNAVDDPVIMFWVGSERKAKRLQNITRPLWTAADAGDLFHVSGAWLSGSVASDTRINRVTNPDFEAGLQGWSAGARLQSMWHSSAYYTGKRSLGSRSTSTRSNYCTSPLHSPNTTGLTGWKAGVRLNRISVAGTSMRIHADRQDRDSFGYAVTKRLSVPGGQRFRFAFDVTGSNNARKWMAAVRFFRANGDQIGSTYTEVGGNTDLSPGRKYSKIFEIPTQARKMRVMIGVAPTSSSVNATMDIRDVTLNEENRSTGPLSGSDGADYYWTGTVNDSRSVYHPGQDIWVDSPRAAAVVDQDYIGSAYVRTSTGVQTEVQIRAYNSSGSLLPGVQSTIVTGDNTWKRIVTPALTTPDGTTHVGIRVIARDLERSERMYVDAAMIERSSVDGGYFSGNTANAGGWKYRWAGAVNNSLSYAEQFAPTPPVPETPGPDTLVSSDKDKNVYSVQVFYTISTELGESAPSQPVTLKVQRPWTSWLWEDAAGDDTSDAELCADQLIMRVPAEVFDAAMTAQALHWTAYVATWGPNDPPSVTAVRFSKKDLIGATYDLDGFTRLTPLLPGAGAPTTTVPTESVRFNATDPRKGSQGLVAADRLVTVGAPHDPARISWTAAAAGDYANFSSALGGGSKVLTSGNLFLTACVKLWQNPQSVDTLTILTRGDDGRSAAYYMEPATITSLSETIQVMGFEEVSGMSGTIAPYGCEVLNNALYRPEFHGLIKSTANNYNLNHKVVSDTIENQWRVLQNPQRMVSAVLDFRIYYLVHNAFGETLEDGCLGNEVWVMDTAGKTPTWSRWAVQGTSLRAMDIDGVVMMSITRPDGIFVFSPDRYTDERFNPSTGDLERVNIPWYLETNTQGANRAHDAWCMLQQANVELGNFEGQLEYGIRGRDVNGMVIDMSKRVISSAPAPDLTVLDDDYENSFKMPTLNPSDQEDYFLIRKVMKEWVFFAGSVYDEVPVEEPVVRAGEPDPDLVVQVPRSCGGQISLVQYRYTPASVNVGYEYGSVETFEYGAMDDRLAVTDSGTPKPYVDRSPT